MSAESIKPDNKANQAQNPADLLPKDDGVSFSAQDQAAVLGALQDEYMTTIQAPENAREAFFQATSPDSQNNIEKEDQEEQEEEAQTEINLADSQIARTMGGILPDLTITDEAQEDAILGQYSSELQQEAQRLTNVGAIGGSGAVERTIDTIASAQERLRYDETSKEESQLS